MEARGVTGGELQLGSEVEEPQLSRQGLVLGESGADHIKAAAFGTGVGQEAIAAENDAKAPDRALHRCRQRLGELCHRNQSVFVHTIRSEEHTSELQSLMRISYAVFCLKKKKNIHPHTNTNQTV